ncbi:Uncharacterised protein [Vibrio cholerae]|nr:Uncharacterised protein [Vibrio cholerae]
MGIIMVAPKLNPCSRIHQFIFYLIPHDWSVISFRFEVATSDRRDRLSKIII